MTSIRRFSLRILRNHWTDIALAIIVFTGITLWMQRDMLELEQQADNFVLNNLSQQAAPILHSGERTLVYFFAPGAVYVN